MKLVGRLAAAASLASAAVHYRRQRLAHSENAPSSLGGKVALVTGGTGAIGWAVASTLAAQGCNIALVDLDQTRCDAFAAKLPTPSIGLAFDVSDPSACLLYTSPSPRDS